MAIDVEWLIIIKNNTIMSNERTGVDRVLDWIVQIRFSEKWMSIEVERFANYTISHFVGWYSDTHCKQDA